MQHITGISRYQMRFSSLEDTISLYNQVRFIDAFVESLELAKLGFIIQTLKGEGRPSYDTKVFLKIYLYGYLNSIRSIHWCSFAMSTRLLVCTKQSVCKRLYKQITIKKVGIYITKKSIVFFIITPFLAIRVANALI
jgi:hypothetical protein